MSCGGMAERSKAVVLKTAELSGSVGSNPTPSATRPHFVLVDGLRPSQRILSPAGRTDRACGPRWSHHGVAEVRGLKSSRSAEPSKTGARLAEGEGFEPSKGVNPYTLSKRAH